jgi:hypothetical protein
MNVVHSSTESKSLGKPLKMRLDGGTGMCVLTTIILPSYKQRDKPKMGAVRSLQIGAGL